MLLFHFKVHNTKLLPKCLPLTIGGDVDYVKCVFDNFSSDWDDMTHRKVLFKNQSYNIVKTTEIESDGTCLVPAEVYIKPGIIDMLVYDDVGEKYTRTVKLFSAPDLKIKSTGEIVDTPSSYPDFNRKVKDVLANASESTYELFIKEMEEYVKEYAEDLSGTKDYNELINKPSIESVELINDKTFSDLGLDSITRIELDMMIYLGD